MNETWFVAEDVAGATITVDGAEQDLVVVTQEVLDARPY